MKELKTILKCLRGLPYCDQNRIDDFGFAIEEMARHLHNGPAHKLLQLEQRLRHLSMILLADSLHKSISDTWG